ncbi:MAG TPA: aminodeoxychorismate/anthranilate synthase component II [Gammaproteobacteria bacterium]|nr:aminodeoxychorismate/anthranilate synthase component II [Gammaproteobacteria bacterium]
MILMIDNYDSFTYNLVQYCGELGKDVEVVRNDAITIENIRTQRPEAIIISPGPCTPNEAGISMAVVSQLAPQIPILGVCLGHQSIAQAVGGRIVHAGHVMHGKTSNIYHHDCDVFAGLDMPFVATRYHSLVVDRESLPSCLQITAWTETSEGEVEEIMGLRRDTLPLYGVQFHPESILTEGGHDLLANFFSLAAGTH